MSEIQYVVFALGTEEYGIDISFAQEIIRIPQRITKMPNMPSYIEGMINLRDKIIPVIDLKKRFGLEQGERSTDSRLLILKLENVLLGTIVDDVAEVLKIDDRYIEKLGSDISVLGNNSVKGIGKVGERLIVLIDAMQIRTEIFKNNN